MTDYRDTASLAEVQAIPVIACDAQTAGEWFAVLQKLFTVGKRNPALADTDAWRSTYNYAQAQFEQAFAVLP